MTLRNERVRKELMRDISDIFRKEVRGLEGVVSIVDVEVSHDNSYAKVYYSVLGSPEQVEKDKAIIEKNTGKVRFEIGKTPSAKGSSVPVCPICLILVTRLKIATTS